MVATAFGAVNSLLLGAGLDLGGQVAALHQAAWPAVKDSWGTRNDALRAAVHLYAHIQLRLGRLEVESCVPRPLFRINQLME